MWMLNVCLTLSWLWSVDNHWKFLHRVFGSKYWSDWYDILHQDISFRGTGNTQNWLCSTPGQLTALSLQFKWLQKIRFLPNFKLEKGESFFAKSARGLRVHCFQGWVNLYIQSMWKTLRRHIFQGWHYLTQSYSFMHCRCGDLPSVSREVTKLLLTVVRVSKLPEKSECS